MPYNDARNRLMQKLMRIALTGALKEGLRNAGKFAESDLPVDVTSEEATYVANYIRDLSESEIGLEYEDYGQMFSLLFSACLLNQVGRLTSQEEKKMIETSMKRALLPLKGWMRAELIRLHGNFLGLWPFSELEIQK